MAFYRLIGEWSRSRRWRRYARVWKRRCPLWIFSLCLLSLVYLSFFDIKVQFHGLRHGLVNQGISVDEIGELEFSRPPRAKSRKHHVQCEVGFLESVDDLVEPENYMNFTQFLLRYITKEEIPRGNNVFEPRFGGHQTLKQRENSYYARSQTLHCGFVKGPEGFPSTGFDLHEKDKEYMATCKVVVSSCIFGSSDFLRRPTKSKIRAYSKKNVCFVMFLDELTLAKLSSEGQIPDDNGYIGLWRIILVNNLPYADMRKSGKVPKFLSHRLFQSARYSIWIDSKMRLQADPLLILEYFLWRKGSEYAISSHYDRHCVWEEVLQNKRLNKYNHSAIDEQFQFYQSDGLIKFNESDPSVPLPSYVPEGSFIVRAHTPMSNLFSCLWFNEVSRFTSRDQLSFAYTFLKLRRMNPGKPFFLNMFKDCERRAIAKLFHHRTEDSHPPPAS
ncbi:uncharacterized protein LOC103720215 [Phoenix dactylifera]|uniref:Uncharacterized protein LOC103720215 n=1 Tax=Phoenix dactylifera TaxID=42345 RepID=A0A8B9A990_PHODC|nr:uncharacterized protein LOC103720215 [Phoenix dactylifera]XP_038983190.1 uncharacterized protein LOC103720215 [Phoenix dactylifera]